ncbi:NTP transferase domain-containing protein [uncultured Ruegeria sp.]|uniref:NTP transferase domain-containing protein n=1 Tax=uncultured Ruegeria sp. TaxID=259304 RepID=UPI00261F2CD9|nr:NTP transferase domain-containing protein [uncultured Ruegeria sp.]
MPEVSAIILAAEQSQRMGASNKVLLDVEGVAMIRQLVNQYRTTIDGNIIVAAEHDTDKVQASTESTDTRCVLNPDHANGQLTSVASGLAPALRARLMVEPPERPGCMRITRDHPELVCRHPQPSAGFSTDVDTLPTTPQIKDAVT